MKKVYIFIFVLVILFIGLFPYKKEKTKILFVGDMNFDRYIRQVGEKKGEDFIFSCKNSDGVSLSDFLKSYDLVVGNLEGPITDNASVSLGTEEGSSNNFVFTFPPSTTKLLAKNNIKLVNLGNNHIGNFGTEGINSTKNYLAESGIKYFGQPSGATSDVAKWGNISFISYNEFEGEGIQKVSKKIKEEKDAGNKVIIYSHWGDEYADVPERVKNIAELFAKLGADLIIGSHPHIILPSEILRLRSRQEIFVYYSLGNFIFDQYWNKDVSTGLVLEIDIKNEKINITEHKVSLNKDGRTCLVN